MRITPSDPAARRSVAPLECEVLQLATALNLQHNRLSSLHGLKQRPDLLNGFGCLLVYLVNDVPREQVRCVSVQAWGSRNYDDSRRFPRNGQGVAEPFIQIELPQRFSDGRAAPRASDPHQPGASTKPLRAREAQQLVGRQLIR
jgi:hypothetical protein